MVSCLGLAALLTASVCGVVPGGFPPGTLAVMTTAPPVRGRRGQPHWRQLPQTTAVGVHDELLLSRFRVTTTTRELVLARETVVSGSGRTGTAVSLKNDTK